MLPNLAHMDTNSLDTIAGAKILRERFRSGGVERDHAVMHGDRHAVSRESVTSPARKPAQRPHRTSWSLRRASGS
jgi:hypothetical protein